MYYTQCIGKAVICIVQSNRICYGYYIWINGTNTNSLYLQSQKLSAPTALLTTTIGTSGTSKGIDITQTSTSTGTHIGAKFDNQNGVNNWAIRIINGDIKTPSGTGVTQTGSYTNFTIEKGIIIAAS